MTTDRCSKPFPCCRLSFLYHLLMSDNHFLEGGLPSLFQSIVHSLAAISSVCSHLADSILFSHVLYRLMFLLSNWSFSWTSACHNLHASPPMNLEINELDLILCLPKDFPIAPPKWLFPICIYIFLTYFFFHTKSEA